MAFLKHRSWLPAVVALVLAPVIQAAESAPAPRFAAPDVAASLPSGTASGIGQVTFALVLVLAAVFVVALLVKRLRAVAGGGVNGIEVLSQASLGAKERAVIIRVGNARLLLGVASGQVSLLHTLPPEEIMPASTFIDGSSQRPSFAALLKKSLGR